MFSGIIQAIVSVHSIYEEETFKTYDVILPKHMLFNIKIGSSLSNNGCCLTVIDIDRNLIKFYLTHTTLKLTNMYSLKKGDLINLEKSICYNDEIGGHLMTGHIDCTGEIKKIFDLYKKNKIIWIQIQKQNLQKYCIQKGSIGIDGISLTINKVINNYIRVCVTPYTAKNTTLGIKKVGDIINIEIDFIIKSIIDSVNRIKL